MDPPRTRAALAREIYRLQNALPALAMRREFETAVHAGQFIVVKGETGSGKSTQLPQYLADMRGIDGQVSLHSNLGLMTGLGLGQGVHIAKAVSSVASASCISPLEGSEFGTWSVLSASAWEALTACLLSLLVHCKAAFDWHLLHVSLF